MKGGTLTPKFNVSLLSNLDKLNYQTFEFIYGFYFIVLWAIHFTYTQSFVIIKKGEIVEWLIKTLFDFDELKAFEYISCLLMNSIKCFSENLV